MPDRGALDLNQLTQRLLASRDRAKRQWFLEQIGHIWSRPGRSCFACGGNKHRPHAEPTSESVAAVQSFVADPKMDVRRAVVFALRQVVSRELSVVHTLQQMLLDEHPIVRCNATLALLARSLEIPLSDDVIEDALRNET